MELELNHLRDIIASKDLTIHEQRIKMSEMQRRIEESGLDIGRIQSDH